MAVSERIRVRIRNRARNWLGIRARIKIRIRIKNRVRVRIRIRIRRGSGCPGFMIKKLGCYLHLLHSDVELPMVCMKECELLSKLGR